jgi:DNA-binding response OmpR family regulator
MILLAQSNEDDALIIQNAFRDAGMAFQVLVLKDAEQALAYLRGEGRYGERTTFPSPHLLVIDRNLRLNGAIEILQWLGQHSGRDRKMRVLVLSGADDITIKQEVVALGADAFVLKPFRYDDWVALVRDWKRYLTE